MKKWLAAFGILIVLWLLWKKLEIRAFSQSRAALVAIATPRPHNSGPSGDSPLQPQAATKQIKILEPESPDDFDCLLQELRVPIGGELKIWKSSYDLDEDGEPGTGALIYSSECPPGLFSKVRVNRLGRIKELIDCRSTTRESLYAQSGIQGNVLDREATEGHAHLAISGEGYFVLLCEDGYRLTRDGDFLRSDQAKLKSTNGCELLDRSGQPFVADDELDEHGCIEGNRCVAIARVDPAHVVYEDRLTYRTNADIFRSLVRDPRLFTGSLEEFTDPETGPTGPKWEKLAPYRVIHSCRR